MAAWPITGADVEQQLGVGPAPTDEAGAAHLAQVAAAAHAWVVANVEPVLVEGRPSEAVVLGTVMLAARYYARRGSVLGVASFGEFGPSYVMRHDPDVAQLLGLGKPGVA